MKMLKTLLLLLLINQGVMSGQNLTDQTAFRVDKLNIFTKDSMYLNIWKYVKDSTLYYDKDCEKIYYNDCLLDTIYIGYRYILGKGESYKTFQDQYFDYFVAKNRFGVLFREGEEPKKYISREDIKETRKPTFGGYLKFKYDEHRCDKYATFLTVKKQPTKN